MLYYAENLTKHSMKLGLPWECPPPDINDKVRKIKEERQRWYQNPSTKHHFYSAYEGLNPNARVSQENPVHLVRAFVFDLDSLKKIPREEIDAIIDTLPIKPNFLEKSVGNGWRLLWLLANPVRWAEDKELVEVALRKTRKALGMADVSLVDEPSWTTLQRLYCNGGEWYPLSEDKLEESFVSKILFSSALELAKKSKSREVPLERVEKLIKKKWKNWEWPSDFVEGSQGPSWWVEGSTSSKSAIVHANGMYTFAAHREKAKYLWADILGPGVIEEDREEKVVVACQNTFYDGRCYFVPRKKGGYRALPYAAIHRRLTVFSGLYSERAKKQKTSELEEAFAYIENTHYVDAAAPLLFRPPGIVELENGKIYLNMSHIKPITPAEGPQFWGPEHNFPFISDFLPRLMVSGDQLEHQLAVLARAYRGALAGRPVRSQANFLAGGVGIGKTLAVHRIFGPLMGGVSDASEYLQGHDDFGGELFHCPVWAIDDQTMVSDPHALRLFTSLIKQHVANSTFKMHEKYMKKIEVEHYGMIFTTCNLDAWSQTVLPALEDSIKDKVNFYRLIDKMPDGYFSIDVETILKRELPFFAAYLRDYQIPEHLLGDVRFGIKAYQDESLAMNAYHNSGSIGHMEIIHNFLVAQSLVNEQVQRAGWRGTATELIGAIRAIPSMEDFVRNMTPRQMNLQLASLNSLQERSALEVSEKKNSSNLRIWTIKLKRTNANS
jgi:hypothetical protein